MPIASGSRLGPYEIVAPLGSGGMGEVYKARDPRLNRLIAIKLLPAAAAADRERRDRFEREAQAIAALNHPNIVTIYSVEKADGVFFLTMELVEGRSLAEALPKGGLSLDRLLKIAIPVADAMAAAHQKGITHRDLKPGNIMLGEGEHNGRVKVLDFGLAKLEGDRSPYAMRGDLTPDAAATGATTLPIGPITGKGSILGTVAYMSPEQAEGKPIDARSDLFSLGVMLGGSPKRVMDDVWTPISWSPDGQRLAFVRVSPPRGLSSLVMADANGSHERVLAERRRPATILHLNIFGFPDVAPAWSPNGRVLAVAAGQQRTDGTNERLIICVEVSTGSERVIRAPVPVSTEMYGPTWLDDGTLALIEAPNRGAPPQVWRLSYPDGRSSRLTNDVVGYRGLSVTAARDALVTTRTDPRASIWVGDGAASTGTEIVASAPFFGGTNVAANVTWAGDRLLYVTANGRFAIASVLPGRGTPEEIVVNAQYPAATSDGRTIVFRSTEEGARAGVWKMDADGRHAVQLMAGSATHLQVTADNRRVVFDSGRSGLLSPWIVPIEGGTPTQVANLMIDSPGGDGSSDGQPFLFVSRDEQNRLTIIVCDLPACANRKSLALPPNSAGAFGHWRWTPDGQGIAYQDSTRTNIWVQPLGGKPPYQLTHFSDGREIGDFAWSRDGKRLAISRVSVTNDIVLFKGLKK